ncbi:hypothetical protein [Leptospira tipperaryensis]|nr:hypothetical protein [Leptospira tipperaryensis]
MESKKRYNRINEDNQDRRLIASRAFLSCDDVQKIYEFDGSGKITSRNAGMLNLSRYKNHSMSGFLLTRRSL